MKTTIMPWPLSLALLAGCSGEKAAPQQASASQASAAAEAPAPDPVAIARMDLCALLPADAVAAALDAGAKQPGRPKDYAGSYGCVYGLDPSGGANFEHAAAWVMPPTLFGELASRLDTAKGLGQQAHGEAVAGLGDQAYLVVNESEQQSSVHVLLSGKAAIEASAGTPGHARILAEMVLEAYAQQQ